MNPKEPNLPKRLELSPTRITEGVIIGIATYIVWSILCGLGTVALAHFSPIFTQVFGIALHTTVYSLIGTLVFYVLSDYKPGVRFFEVYLRRSQFATCGSICLWSAMMAILGCLAGEWGFASCFVLSLTMAAFLTFVTARGKQKAEISVRRVYRRLWFVACAAA